MGGVKLRPTGAEAVSALALAPIGLSEEDLKEYLSKHGVDISKIAQNPTKALKDLSRETLKGECSIMQNGRGETVRIVDLVILKITDPADGSVLVQTEMQSDGSTVQVQRLPEAKRRQDENHFK